MEPNEYDNLLEQAREMIAAQYPDRTEFRLADVYNLMAGFALSETTILKAQLAEANLVLDTIGDQAGPMYVSGTDAEGEPIYRNHYQSLSCVYDLAYEYRNKYPAKKETSE